MLGQGHRAPPGVELPVRSGQLHGGLPVEQGAPTGRRCTRGSRPAHPTAKTPYTTQRDASLS